MRRLFKSRGVNNAAGGNTQHDKKHECVMGVHIEH
jgi:hypothetical protein